MSSSSRSDRVRLTVGVLLAATLGAGLLGASAAHAATTGITGSVFQDADRDGVRDSGETGFGGLDVYLFDGARTQMLAATTTASDGSYAFPAAGDGDYLVELGSSAWRSIRQTWAPTSGGLRPSVQVHVAGTADVPMGWRPIARSTTDSAPLTEYVSPQGLRVRSYNDVVTARTVYDTLAGGGLVGAEGSDIVVRLDFGPTSLTTFGALGSPGSYSSYDAVVTVSWDSWLDRTEEVLFHEYGHAWSMRYAYLAQQDATLASYLRVRGIEGDSRLESSHMWDRRELIAEDYRQLFGTAAARAVTQENYQLPAAANVPGLKDFLSTTFMQSAGPSPSPSPAPSPSPSPAPAPVAVSGISMNPNPVQSSGTASFSLNVAADVTVQVLDGTGRVVRTVLQGAQGAGAGSAVWDRTDTRGRRVKSGTYSLTVVAVDSAGNRASGSASFNVR